MSEVRLSIDHLSGQSYEAEAAIDAYTMVYVSSAGKVSEVSANTDIPLGWVKFDYAVGDTVTVYTRGKFNVIVKAANSFALDDVVVIGANGEAEAGPAGVGDWIVGYADNAASAGELVSFEFRPELNEA